MTKCSYMFGTEKVKHRACFSADGPAGLGTGALRPNYLLLTTSVLSHLSCRRKQALIQSPDFKLQSSAVRPVILHFILLKLILLNETSCSSLQPCRTVRSD